MKIQNQSLTSWEFCPVSNSSIRHTASLHCYCCWHRCVPPNQYSLIIRKIFAVSPMTLDVSTVECISCTGMHNLPFSIVCLCSSSNRCRRFDDGRTIWLWSFPAWISTWIPIFQTFRWVIDAKQIDKSWIVQFPSFRAGHHGFWG